MEWLWWHLESCQGQPSAISGTAAPWTPMDTVPGKHRCYSLFWLLQLKPSVSRLSNACDKVTAVFSSSTAQGHGAIAHLGKPVLICVKQSLKSLLEKQNMN